MPIWLTIAIGLGASIVAGVIVSERPRLRARRAVAALLVGAVGAGYRPLPTPAPARPPRGKVRVAVSVQAPPARRGLDA